MIKVLNVISDTNMGGAGKCVIYFSQNYDTSKYEVSVVLPEGSALIPELEKTPVKLIKIDGMKDKSWDFKSLPKLIKIIKQEKPDIVHTHASSTARLAARFVKNTKIIYTKHCAYPLKPSEKWGIKKWFYKTLNECLSDKIIAVSEATRDILMEHGISRDYIKIVYNGVNQIEELTPTEKKQLREKHHVKEEESVVGIIARIEKLKGHDTFVDVAEKMVKKKKNKVKFFIIGTGSYEEEIKQKVKEKKLEKEIIFTGFVNNVGDYLNIMDVQLNCSNETEAASLSLLEGMSVGVPAVVTNCSGNPYLIQDGENGFVVEIDNAEQMAQQTEKILEDKDLREDMKKKAKQKYEEKYTVKKYTENVESVYEEVNQTPRKRHFNPLDVLIILIGILVLLVGYHFLNQNEVGMMDNTQTVVYQIKTTETIPEVYDMIEVGMPLYNSDKNFYMGVIKDKKVEKSIRQHVNLETGEYCNNPIDDYVDITLTVEANAKKNAHAFTIGEMDIKVGVVANVKGKGFAANGYVTVVER